MNFSGARSDLAMIGSLPPPREFRACPTHKDFVEFGISDFNHLSQRQDREESIRRYEAHHTSLPLTYGISVKRWSQENPQHSQLRHLSSDSKTNYQILSRNVVKEAYSALRHCGRGCPRVHHPHAQESMSCRLPKPNYRNAAKEEGRKGK